MKEREKESLVIYCALLAGESLPTLCPKGSSDSGCERREGKWGFTVGGACGILKVYGYAERTSSQFERVHH